MSMLFKDDDQIIKCKNCGNSFFYKKLKSTFKQIDENTIKETVFETTLICSKCEKTNSYNNKNFY